MLRRIASVLCVVWVMMLGAPIAGAQGADQGLAPSAFEPVSPDELNQEQLPAAPLVFAAYAFVWFALVSYVFVLWRRLSQVERELDQVLARLHATRS